jgi:hypothetical protein
MEKKGLMQTRASAVLLGKRLDNPRQNTEIKSDLRVKWIMAGLIFFGMYHPHDK